MNRALADSFVKEVELQAQVTALAKLHHWLSYHTLRSTGSQQGFPDLVLVRPPRVIFAELKAEKGRLSTFQEVWLEELAECPGIETYLWRPSDWPEIERTLE